MEFGYTTDEKVTTPMLKEYIKLLDQGEFKGTKCKKCGTENIPPRDACTNCFSREYEWVDMPREAKLVAFSFFDNEFVCPDSMAKYVPYVIAIGELTNGKRVAAHLTTSELPEVGMKLKIITHVIEEGKRITYKFVPA
ncbi:MAG: Zn-ribbon domain-containing OB-fold protein [Candidatus Hodarchaeota archaeon]